MNDTHKLSEHLSDDEWKKMLKACPNAEEVERAFEDGKREAAEGRAEVGEQKRRKKTDRLADHL